MSSNRWGNKMASMSSVLCKLVSIQSRQYIRDLLEDEVSLLRLLRCIYAVLARSGNGTSCESAVSFVLRVQRLASTRGEVQDVAFDRVFGVVAVH